MLIHNDSSFDAGADICQTSVFFLHSNSTKVCTFNSNCDIVVTVSQNGSSNLFRELHKLYLII